MGIGFLQLLFPRRCVLCNELLNDPQLDMCPECRLSQMVIVSDAWKIPHIKGWIPLWRYGGFVRASLIRYKFHHRRSYCRTYGAELAQKLAREQLPVELITWVPVSWQRRSVRGYDQVKLLAYEVAKHLDLPVVSTLKKCRHNRKQASIHNKQQRDQNVKGVYRVRDPESIAGKRVLLLDDIITTGATVSEAAKTLKKAGAKVVYAACVAAASGQMR